MIRLWVMGQSTQRRLPAPCPNPQVLGSVLFILMYYYRRITWRLRNRKGKQRIARAARDALALKKKHSDTFDLHVTASAATSVTDKVRRAGPGAGGRVGRRSAWLPSPRLCRAPGAACHGPGVCWFRQAQAGMPCTSFPTLCAPLIPLVLQLGAGLDPAWMAQRQQQQRGPGDDSGSDLGSEDYTPRSSDASPSARRWGHAGSAPACHGWASCTLAWGAGAAPTTLLNPHVPLLPPLPRAAASNATAAGASRSEPSASLAVSLLHSSCGGLHT